MRFNGISVFTLSLFKLYVVLCLGILSFLHPVQEAYSQDEDPLNLDLPTPDSDGLAPSRQEETSDEIPQSSPNWRYPHTPLKVRFSVYLGDQVGGPIRFNTRFPEVKSDPHPASYYHALPLVGGELEYAVARGGVLLGAQFRRDLWHSGIKGRSLKVEEKIWQVDDFSVSSSSFVFGWMFGERYREAPWTADLALVYDRGSAEATLSDEMGVMAIGQSGIESLSLRSRLHLSLGGSGHFNFSLGPDFHVPMWQSTSDQSDGVVKNWFSRHTKLESVAAVGFSLMTNYRL